VWAPSMVERNAPTYEVGWLGDDNTVVGAAKDSIVGAEASSSKSGNTNAVPRSTTAQCCTVPPISWRRVSTTNTVPAIVAASHMRLATSLSLADAVAANTVAHFAAPTAAASGLCTPPVLLLPMLQHILLICSNVIHWPMPTPPTPQRVRPPPLRRYPETPSRCRTPQTRHRTW
jgi:hypothetical protein